MKTLSEKQLAANRANAAKSTGPRTPEGKSRAAGNSRKHGLAAPAFTVADCEDRDALANLIADAVAHYRPQGSQEHFAVERLALAQLAILRAYRLEAGALASSFDGGRQLVTGATLATPNAQRDTQALAEGFHLMAGDGQSFALLLRYQAQADRQYRRAVEDLQRLLRERTQDDSPNEPISDPEPEQTKPEPAPADEPAPARNPTGLLRVSAPLCQGPPIPTHTPPDLLK